MAAILKLISSLILGLNLFIPHGQPAKTNSPQAAFVPQQSVITHGPRDKKVVALTFDADMTPKMKKDLQTGKVSTWYNKKIIDILNADNVPATLFLSGMWIELYPKETVELSKNPLFQLANHSYSHPAFEKKCTALNLIPHTQDEEEITKTQKLLKDVAGVDNHYFRFPGGCYDDFALNKVHELGLDVVGWDVTSSDAFNPNEGQLITNVLNHAQNGSIILMHMIGNRNAPQTANALPTIIAGLKAKGFGFVKLSELLQ